LRCYKAAKLDEVIGSSVTLTGRQLTLSDLTSSPCIIDDGTSNNDAANIHRKKGGRPKGSTKAAAEKINAVVKESVTTATIRYNEALQKALNSGKKVVPKGTLEKIVSDVETEAGLSKNSISLETVRSRIKRGNLDATKTYSISPIADLEPLIVEFCIRLAKIGDPLTKKTVIQLANSLVVDNDYQSRINNCKSDRKLLCNGLLGDAWYRGFMHWQKDVLTRKGSTVKDMKRSTWAT
jgi:hypothetical protein